MNSRRMVVVTPYNREWPERFRRLRDSLWPHVQDLALRVEHVGSTSVPGLAAKPVIDLDLVIPSRDLLDAVAARLTAIGYERLGDLGIADREAFREPEGLSRHNLYVCPCDSVGLRNHVALRDHLRRHPADAQAYAALKRELAARFPDDVDRYAEGKTEFILGILAQYGFSSDKLEDIRRANQVE